MARKNNAREERSIHFNTRTGAVMAESKQENLREKLKAVREVVPGKNRDELVMVLQYFEYNVEKTIQAYLEDGAKKVLQEWNHTQPNRKGKGRPRERPDPKAKEAAATVGPTKARQAQPATVNGATSATANGDVTHHAGNNDDDDTSLLLQADHSSLSNGHLPDDGSDNAEMRNDAKPSSTSTGPPQPQRHNQQQRQQQQQQQQQQHRGDKGKNKGHRESHSVHHNSLKQHHQRERTMSERSNASSAFGGDHGHHSLDKSFKDLQRQTTSLERLKHLLDSEIDRSSKSVSKVFEEIRKGLGERENKILAELEVVKKEANEMLESRHSKAVDLKRMVERAERMKESEIADLRAQIKHFVSDRRHDEEMGRTTRFMYDSDHMLKGVHTFGEVIHIPKIVSRQVSTTASLGHNQVSGNSSSHNDVADIEDRLKHSLHIQDLTHQSAAPPNGPRNKGSNDKRGGPKSSQSQKSNPTSSAPASSPPPPTTSSSSSPAPPKPQQQTPTSPSASAAPPPQSQRPQQQRQRRPDSRRNRGGGGGGGGDNSATTTNTDNNSNNHNNQSNQSNDNSNSNNAAAVTSSSPPDNNNVETSGSNNNNSRSSNRRGGGGREGGHGQGQSRGGGGKGSSGRGGRGGRGSGGGGGGSGGGGGGAGRRNTPNPNPNPNTNSHQNHSSPDSASATSAAPQPVSA